MFLLYILRHALLYSSVGRWMVRPPRQTRTFACTLRTEKRVRLLTTAAVPPHPPPSRTDWTRLVPPPVLTGHVSSLLPDGEEWEVSC